MKPLQTLLTIDSVGQRCISLEEGLERKNLSVIHKVDELPLIDDREVGTIYYSMADEKYYVCDENGTSYVLYPSTQDLTGYVKYTVCQDEEEYEALSNKDNETLYLIPEE